MQMHCSRHATITVLLTLNAEMRTSCLLLTAAASWTLAVARGLVVDLGYETYKGYYNSTYDLNIWKGYVKVCLIGYKLPHRADNIERISSI